MRTTTLATILLCAACNIDTSSLTATRYLAATIVDSPAVTIGGSTQPGAAAFTAYFGDIDVTKGVAADALTPRPGALMTLTWKSANGTDNSVNIADNGGGAYGVTSANSKLAVEQTKYTLTITFSGSTYTATVTPGAPVQMTNFSAQPVLAWKKTDDFAAIRADGGGSSNPPAFLTVGKINTADPTNSSNITFTTVPRDAASLLQFVVDDSAFHKSPVTAPAAQAFPTAGPYAVLLSAAVKGNTGSNLFVGSLFMATSSSAGALNVQ